MKQNSKRAAALRLALSVILVLTMMGPLSLTVPAAAQAATPSPHGSTISVELRAPEANNGEYSKNDITQKSINTALDIKIEILDTEQPGTRTFTFAKPRYATVTAAGGQNYTDHVQSVSGAGSGSELVTVTLKNMDDLVNFDLVFTQTYNQALTWTQTITYAPEYKLNGTTVTQADPVKVTTNCTTNVYSSVRVASENTWPKKDVDQATYESTIASYLEPASTLKAKVGASYSMRHSALTNLPGAIFGETGYVNGMRPTESHQQVTLPKEATLSDYDAAYWVVSTDGEGRTVITSIPTNIEYPFYFSYQAATALPSRTFVVTYDRVPDGGLGYYEYQSRIWGAFWGGETFDVSNPSSKHYLDPAAAVPKVTAYTGFSPDCFGPTCLPDGARSLNESSLYLAIGDTNNHRYYVQNNGEVDLVNVVCDLPFDGDIWDIKNFLLSGNSLPAPVSETFKELTLTYSDGTTKTVAFNDASLFDQSKLTYVVNTAYCNYCAPDLEAWCREGKGDSVYITNVKVTIASLPVGSEVYFGLNTTLRDTRRSDSSAVAPGTNVVSKINVAAQWKTDSTKTVSGTSTSTKAIVSADTKQTGNLSLSGSHSGVKPAYTAGETISATSNYFLYLPTLYRGRIEGPVVTVAVPTGYALDPASFALQMGSGPSVGNNTPQTFTPVDPLQIEYLGMTARDDKGVDLYQFRYAGDMGYRADWYLRATYTVTVPVTAKNATGVKIQSFLTEKNNVQQGSNVSVADVYGLTSPTLATIPGVTSTFSVTRTTTSLFASLANGDVEATSTWKQDGTTELTRIDANLARVQDSGTLRFQAVNGSTSPLAGKAYVMAPKGDFVPSLTNIKVTSTSMDSGVESDITSAVTIEYTNNVSGIAAPAADWVAYNPANPTSANGAVAFRFTYATIAASSIANMDLSYTIPASATHNQVVRGQGITDLTRAGVPQGIIIANYAGFRVVKPEVVVNYHKDTESMLSRYATTTLTGSLKAGDPASQITIASGTAEGELSYALPTGYVTPTQQGTIPYAVQDYAKGASNPNVISVVAVKNVVSVPIEYYTGNSVATGTLVGSSSVAGKVIGDKITIASGSGTNELNAHKPASGFNDGIQIGGEYTVKADGTDKIYVLYAPSTSNSYTVKYYIDSVDTANYLDEVTYPGKTTGETISLSQAELDAEMPEKGFYNATVDPAHSVTVIGPVAADNIVSVVYTRKTTLSATIEYYRAGSALPMAVHQLTGLTFEDEITVASGTAAGQLNYAKANLGADAAGYADGVQSAPIPFVVDDDPAHPNVIKVIYSPRTDLSYTIRYYKDSATTGDLITSETVTPATYGTPITVAASKIDNHQPEGFGVGSQTNAATVTVAGAVVNVVYPRLTNLSATVEYYTDTLDAENLAETETLSNLTFDATITSAMVDAGPGLNIHQPTGYKAGVLQDTSVKVAADGSSVVRVLYTKKDTLTAQIVYHTGSASGTVIGRSSILTNLTYGDVVSTTGVLDAFRPATGYKSGVASGTWTVDDIALNEFHVYYPIKDDLTYKVRYHKDSATGEVISTSASSATTHEFGEPITLSSAELSAGKSGLSAAYGDGVQATTPYVMIDGENIIDVYYPKLNNQNVTVSYVTETLSGDTTTTVVLGGKNIGDIIEFTPSEIASHAPAGSNHEPGVQVGGAYTVVDGTNEITVRYALKSASYTVKYYKDAVDTANYIGQVNSSSSFKAGEGVVLTSAELSPTGALFDLLLDGYLRTGEQTPARPFVLAAGAANEIAVVFSPLPRYEVTVKYFTQDVDLLGKTEIASSETTLPSTYLPGDRIILTEAQRNASLPSKGFTEGAQNDPAGYIVVAGANMIEVTYPRKTNLTYQIEYHKGSPTGELLGYSQMVNGQIFEDEVELDAPALNALKPPKGYADGVQDGGFSTLSAFAVLDTTPQTGVPFIVDDANNTIIVYYPLRTDLTYTVEYRTGSVAGPLIFTSDPVTDQTFGTQVTLDAATLNAHKPSGPADAGKYYDGEQVGKPYIVEDDGGVITVVYRANSAPVVTIQSDVLYVKKGATLAKTQFLNMVGASASDPEQGPLPISAIEIEGWDGVNFLNVNYPSGAPMTVRLSVVDELGLRSTYRSVAIFVMDPSTPTEPVGPDKNLPTPPEGYEWGRDANGNYVLVPAGTNRTISTTRTKGTSPKSGDALPVSVTFTALLGVAAAAALLGSRRKREDEC